MKHDQVNKQLKDILLNTYNYNRSMNKLLKNFMPNRKIH